MNADSVAAKRHKSPGAADAATQVAQTGSLPYRRLAICGGLIYNPPPLGRLIGRACTLAFRSPGQDTGRRILAELESRLDR